jgi:lipid II:glycine glycyltransferase (peptidoglycan interpeptide bridge formation enzyme)
MYRHARMGATVFQERGPVRIESVSSRHRWNDLIIRLPDYSLEQGFEWGEILKESGCEPHRYAAFDGDDCVAAISMFRWHPPMVQSSVLYAPRGPLIGSDNGPARRALSRAIKETAKATRAVFLRVSPGAPLCRADLHASLIETGFVRLPEDWTIWNAPRIVMTLKLEGSDDAVLSRISSSRRREIKVTQAAGVSIVDARDSKDLGLFYRLLVQMGRRKTYPVRRRRHFEAVWREYQASGSGILLFARHRAEILGGLIGTRLGRTAYFLYSATSRGNGDDTEKLHPAALLYWHFIRWARANGCESIHWGGSGTRLPPTPGDPGYGVYQFKRSFGSDCVKYLGYYDRVFRPGMYGLLRTGERRYGELAWKIRARMNR